MRYEQGTVIINGIKFEPDPDIQYKSDYVKCAHIIEDRKKWTHKSLGLSPNYPLEQLNKEIVEKLYYRYLVLNDLWFILYFVMGLPDHIANTRFAVQQCKLIGSDDFNGEGYRQPTLDIWARGHLKAIDLNEPVPTPKGWKKHGDLNIGDKLFSPSGKIIRVIGKSPVFYDKDCYRITFDTGYSLIASGDHLWSIEVSHSARINKSNRRTGYKIVNISTRDLMKELGKVKSLKTRILPRIPVSLPVYNQKKNLPIDPYVLGVWLGDGTVKSNHITSGLQDYQEMIENIGICGHKTSFIKRPQWKDKTKIQITILIDPGIKGKKGSSKFRNALRLLNIFNNKHIPNIYLNSSIQDRFALLQGLMDTDGTIHKKHSQISFSSSKYDLAKQVYRLISSLGIKCSIKKNYSMFNGKKFDTWQLHFTAKRNNPPFRLKRKIARCCNGTIQQSRYRRIKKVEIVNPIPTSCIKVDSPDGLYLIGSEYITTHNTSVISIAETTQYHLKYPDRCTIFFAYKKGLAEKISDSVRRAYESPFLITHFPDRLYANPMNDSPLWTVEKGFTIIRKSTTRLEPTIYASGLVEGMCQGFHCERLVFDDFETDDMAGNVEVLNAVFSKFQMAQYLNTKTEYDRQRVLGTIYSHLGPIVRVKDMKEIDGTLKYKTRIVPGTEDGAFDGKPVFWSQKILDKEKKSAHYPMQVLCNPTPLELRKLKSQFITDIDPSQIPRGVLKFMLVDWAGDDKGKRDGCDWAFMVIGVDPKHQETAANNQYLMDCVISPMSTTAAVDMFCTMYMRHGIIQMVGIERSSGDAIKYYAAEMLKKRGKEISEDRGNLMDLNPRGRNKDERILNGVETPMNNGKIFMSTAIPQPVRNDIRLATDQFPFGKKDALDCMAYLPDMLMVFPLDRYAREGEYDYAPPKYKIATICG